MKRVGLAAILSGLVALACGQVTSSTSPSDAGSADAAHGGDATDADAHATDAHATDADAHATDAHATDADAHATDADAHATDAGQSWQKWCEPNMVNDPACPAQQPNGPCGMAGLQCAYPVSSGVALDDCTDQGAGTALWWVATGVLCRYDCGAFDDAGAGTPVGGAACASRTSVACNPGAYQTKQSMLDSQLEALAQSCGVVGGHVIWVGFNAGCATRIVGADSSVATCMANQLAKQRYDCALDRACGVALFAPP